MDNHKATKGGGRGVILDNLISVKDHFLRIDEDNMISAPERAWKVEMNT